MSIDFADSLLQSRLNLLRDAIDRGDDYAVFAEGARLTCHLAPQPVCGV